MFTLETVNKKSLIKIGKIVGVRFCNSDLNNRERIKSILVDRNKYSDTIEIIDFMNTTCRKRINIFMFKVKKLITRPILRSDWYNNYVVPNTNNTTNNTNCNYLVSDNHDKQYLSIDVMSANFQALKELSNGKITETTWIEYFKRIVPNDIRSNSKRNIENGIAGVPIKIPECIYTSKFLRQFILGDLKKLKFLWESKIHMLMKDPIFESYVTHINSDEIIVEISDFESQIFKLDLDMNIFRVTYFRLVSINDFDTFNQPNVNWLIKVFRDGTKRLVNVGPRDYPTLYNKYIK